MTPRSRRGGRARVRAPAAAILAFAAFAAQSLISCGGKPPEIAAIEWRLELRPSPSGYFESLSAFATVKDEDGIEDIDRLWILNDGEALDWAFTSADWTRKAEGADDWIGAAGLARHDYAPMPRGEYRFVLSDAAGERAEKPFRVEGSFPDLAAPEIRLEAGKVRVRSSWPETLVLAYDGTGALVGTAPAPPSAPGSDEGPSVQDLLSQDLAARAVELAAYGYDPSRRMGAYSWKAKIDGR